MNAQSTLSLTRMAPPLKVKAQRPADSLPRYGSPAFLNKTGKSKPSKEEFQLLKNRASLMTMNTYEDGHETELNFNDSMGAITSEMLIDEPETRFNSRLATAAAT